MYNVQMYNVQKKRLAEAVRVKAIMTGAITVYTFREYLLVNHLSSKTFHIIRIKPDSFTLQIGEEGDTA
jgi:hypothetical protein